MQLPEIDVRSLSTSIEACRVRAGGGAADAGAASSTARPNVVNAVRNMRASVRLSVGRSGHVADVVEFMQAQRQARFNRAIPRQISLSACRMRDMGGLHRLLNKTLRPRHAY